MCNNEIIIHPLRARSTWTITSLVFTVVGSLGALMSGQSITNLNPTPQNNNDAVTKSYVDNAITLSGGLSVTELTMQGDMDMSGHEVKGLVDPSQDDMAASKEYWDSNYLDLPGGIMVGDIDMAGREITRLSDVPSTDNSAASKKYVDSKVTGGGGGPSNSGFRMTRDIGMGQNEMYNLPDTPSRDHSAVNKKYVTDNFYNTSGDTMTGNVDMGGHEIRNLSNAVTTDNPASPGSGHGWVRTDEWERDYRTYTKPIHEYVSSVQGVRG